MADSNSLNKNAHQARRQRGFSLAHHLRTASWQVHVFLLAIITLIMLPFAWFVSVAFRPKEELYQLFPASFTLENFYDMFQKVPELVDYYLDSIIITGFTVFAAVLIGTLAGYAFARLKFPGRDVIYWLVVSTIFIPPVMTVASLYIELFALNLVDTYLGLIAVYTAWHLGLSTVIMRNVFAAIPIELEEAAKVDGASAWVILWRIMFPLATGGAVVVALFTFVPVWGEYIFAFTFSGDAVRPMSIGIKLFQPHASDPNYSFAAAAAAALVMFVPSIAIYIFMQRWFTKGLMEGALKG